MRMLQKAALEALLCPGGLVAHDARQQTHDGIKQHQRRRLAAGQNVIADRHFLEPTRVDHTLVDALETPAEDDDTGPGGQFAHTRLRQRRATRAHQQAWPWIVA